MEIQGPRAGRSRTFHLPADGEGFGQNGQTSKNVIAALIPQAAGSGQPGRAGDGAWTSRIVDHVTRHRHSHEAAYFFPAFVRFFRAPPGRLFVTRSYHIPTPATRAWWRGSCEPTRALSWCRFESATCVLLHLYAICVLRPYQRRNHP